MNETSIVDAHVHLWNPAQFRYPWLDELPALNRAWLPADFAKASATAGVGKMVIVECGCKPVQSLAEVIWISDLAKTEPRLRGIVAHAALEKGESVETELAALADWPLVKGVRRNLQSEKDAAFLLQPEFVTGVKRLATFGFTFDLCIGHEQLRATTELVSRVPEVTFVLDHFGKPDVRGKNREPWATELKALAALPNVVGKLSGLTTEADWNQWQADELKFYFDRAWECFGQDRLLFGSDWPVATLATSYQRWVATEQASCPSASPGDWNKIFQTNAERIYRV